MNTQLRTALTAATAAIALLTVAATAQTTPPDAAPAAPQDAAGDTATAPQPDIIVTATSVGRKALDTPLAVTTMNASQLQRTSMTNQADILNTIPTIKADGGGGEVAANVFVRGLPSGGQYQ